MAGSYRHIADHNNEFQGIDLIGNLGDAHEALEECFYMILELTGGDKEKIHQAWLNGYAKKFLHASNEELFTFHHFWYSYD